MIESYRMGWVKGVGVAKPKISFVPVIYE